MSLLSAKPAHVPTRYHSLKDLLAKGWSRGAVKSFLGKPDARLPNPHCSVGAPVRAYCKVRVAKAEQSADYKAWVKSTLARREISSAASISRNETLKRQAIQRVSRDLVCNFPDIGEALLTGQAMAHNRNRVLCLGHDVPLSIENGSQKYAIFINYLADHYSNLEDMTDSLYGCVGRELAERIAKTLFEARAIRFYPFLSGYHQLEDGPA